MQTSISSVSSIAVMATLGAIFLIVFACARRAIKEMGFLDNVASWAVPFCVALLSIIGLVRFIGSSETTAVATREGRETGGVIDVILLPYVALALALLLILLLLAAGKVLRGRETQHFLSGGPKPRTVAKLRMREGDHSRRETKPFVSPSKKQIMGREDREITKHPEGGR